MQKSKIFRSAHGIKNFSPRTGKETRSPFQILACTALKNLRPIINPPDSCILAVGGIVQKPVVKNNTIVPAIL
jgi:pyruvate dehydrogenase E2 component (dihydrolipoamide acetyltransferase)